jgi:hypothetical protein
MTRDPPKNMAFDHCGIKNYNYLSAELTGQLAGRKGMKIPDSILALDTRQKSQNE